MSISIRRVFAVAIFVLFSAPLLTHAGDKEPASSWVLPASSKSIVQKVTGPMAKALRLAWCDAQIKKDAILFEMGPTGPMTEGKGNPKGSTTHRVTAVHPSKVSPQGIVGTHIALESKPGPITADEMKKLIAVLNAADLSGLWKEVKAKPVIEAPAEPKEAPKGVHANFQRVQDLIKMGDNAEAIELLKLPETSPDATPFQRLRAAIFLKKLGEETRAKALIKSSTDPLLKAIEDLVAGQTLKPNDVLKLWDANQSEAMDTCQLIHVAQAAFLLGQSAESEALLKGVFDRDSNCLRAISVLGDNYISQDRKDDAIALVKPLLEKHPDHAEFKMLLAQYYRLDGRLDDAVALYEEVVEQGNARDEHVRLLVTMYLQQRAEKRQITRWKKVYEGNPSNKVAALMIGIMLHYRDEFTESQEWLLPLNDQFKGNPRYQIYRAMNDYNLDGKKEARERLDMAAQLPVIDPDVFYCRGEILRDVERDTAISDFKRYLALTEGSPFNLPEKQARVKEQVRLLEECKRNGTEVCEGPWEHPRGGLLRFFTLHPEAPWISLGIVILLVASGLWWIRRRRKDKAS